MPLNEEQQESLNQIHLGLNAINQAVVDAQQTITGLQSLSKLATGGKRPDYDSFSTEELQGIFDYGIRSTTINNLPDGADADDPGRIPDPHPYSSAGVANAGLAATGMGRPQLIAAVDALMEHNGYNVDPLIIAEAQSMYTNGLSADMDGRFDRCFQRHLTLTEEAGLDYDTQPVEDHLDAVKPAVANFSVLTERSIGGFVNKGLESRLTALAGQKGGNARETAASFAQARDRLNLVNMSGGAKHLAKTEQQSLNLTGMNLRGIDLSQTDLSGVKADATSLSRASGLEAVQGVEPRLLAEAQAIKPHVARLDDLTESLGKLGNKGGVVANALHFRHGGVEGERKHLAKEIGKAEQAMAQARAEVVAQQLAVENEFEPKTTYQLGEGVTRRQGEVKDPRMERMQASETFKVDAQVALNEQGASLAFAKTQIGSKSQRMQEEGADPAQVDYTRTLEGGTLDNVAALYGTTGAVDDAPTFAAKQAALGGEISSLLTRSVATSVVDEALGMNAMAKEKFGLDENGRNVGISVGVPGSSILVRGATLDDKESFLAIDYNDAAVQKGLYDLQAQDYITGQIDRHSGNIFVDPHSGQVTGIDNDMAFPTINREQMVGSHGLDAKAIRGAPQFLHSDTADKIEALSPQALRAALQSIQPPEGVAPLEPEAIEGAVQRLQELQAEIKTMRKEGRVVDRFSEATYNQAMARQQEAGMAYNAPRTSYLATAVMEKSKSIGLGDQRNPIQEDDVPEQRPRGAQLAAYQAMVADARNDIAANPGQLQDASLAKTITDGQQRLMVLQERLQETDGKLSATGARLNEAKAAGQVELAEGHEEIFDKLQQGRQDTLQQIKAEQAKVSKALDVAVAPLKPALAAQARLATPQVEVQQPAVLNAEIANGQVGNININAPRVQNAGWRAVGASNPRQQPRVQLGRAAEEVQQVDVQQVDVQQVDGPPGARPARATPPRPDLGPRPDALPSVPGQPPAVPVKVGLSVAASMARGGQRPPLVRPPGPAPLPPGVAPAVDEGQQQGQEGKSQAWKSSSTGAALRGSSEATPRVQRVNSVGAASQVPPVDQKPASPRKSGGPVIGGGR